MKHAVIATLILVSAGLTSARADSSDSAVDQAVRDAEAQRIAVMDRVKDTVLAIFAAGGGGGGSGVVITPDGFALTNFHVVKPCGQAMKCGMADGELYDAVVVGLDPVGDVALIKLLGRDNFPHAELGDSDQVHPGDWCFAMGNPFLLATDFQPTVTYGIVSGVNRYQYPAGTLLEYADCIQTDASINPGNSGGPLFDAAGNLIGINGRGSFEKRGRVNVGVAYAISINQIKNFLGYLHSGRIVDHATLGAQVATDNEGRVVVNNILDDSDAYRRGLRYDDEIVSFGGRTISTTNGFKNALGIFPKGWRVPLSFRRDGERYDVLVRLAGVHAGEELLEKASGRQREVPMPVPKPEKEPEDGEQPQPEDQPDGGSQPGDDPEKPDKPEPRRIEIPGHDGRPIPIQRLMPPRPPVPEIVKKHYEEKRGFANYYFNKLHRDRVFKAWADRGDFKSTADWTISGNLVGNGAAYRFVIGESSVSLKLPGEEIVWNATDDFSESLLPRNSGGLLPTLCLWRRLAVEGPGMFGDVTYIGTAPLVGHDDLVDVLSGLHKGVECRFYFDRNEGWLLAMEMYPDDYVDPCEVYFTDYREVDGRFVPGRMEARIGDEMFAAFEFDEFQVEKKPEE